jgi:hypothetical protein
MSELKVGFEMKKIRLPLGDILPVRQIGGQQRIDRYLSHANHGGGGYRKDATSSANH